MKVYNKLVRDKIPGIITQDGQKANFRILDDEAYGQALLEKLVEEAQEAFETKGEKQSLVKEISDVLEVIDSLVSAFALNKGEIEKLKVSRKESRGGFDKKLFLESVE